jgi:hypothetical protein
MSIDGKTGSSLCGFIASRGIAGGEAHAGRSHDELKTERPLTLESLTENSGRSK